MSVTSTRLRRLERDVGELLATHREGRSLSEFEPLRDDPVGFVTEVLGGEPWSVQREVANAVVRDRHVTVQSCNGAGKDWLAGRLALWWVYSRRGLVIMTGPTERQVKHVLMRREVRDAWSQAGDLPGDLHELELRVSGAGGILAFTSNDPNKMTGHHHPNGVLLIITEAQGVEPEVWEVGLANTVGEKDRILAVGNPLIPTGPYYEACRSRRWTTFRVSAFDHPNLIEGGEVIPGAVTQSLVDGVRETYGEDSGPYQSRVLGRFPQDSEEALCRREWVEDAFGRWERCGGRGHGHITLSLDVARFGADETVLGVRCGTVLERFATWRGLDTMETVGRFLRIMRQEKVAPGHVMERLGAERRFILRPENRAGSKHLTIVVDEVGLGGGVIDRLRELELSVTPFNGGWAPTRRHTSRFQNARAEAYFGIRSLLEKGRIALPPDPLLMEELTTIRWTTSSTGKVAIEPKDLTKRALGRSPDRGDATAQAFYGDGALDPRDWTTLRW